MCIALHKPAGKVLANRTYENCFDNNSDGAGFAYAENGKIFIQKGFFTFDEFLKAFLPHEKKNCLIHFRIATHGEVNEANCHPWVIPEFDFDGKKYSYAIIHNGVLDFKSSKDKSDTGHFVDEILAPHFQRDPYFPFTDEGLFFLERAIGPTNKLVILRNDGEVAIINHKAGNEDDGVWFSNYSWKTQRFRYAFTHHTVPSAGRGLPSGPSRYDDDDFSFTQSAVDDNGKRVLAGPSVSPGGGVLKGLPWTDRAKADLRHLCRADRKRLRAMARQVCMALYAQPEQMTEVEQVKVLREEFGEFYNMGVNFDGLSVAELDRAILEADFGPSFLGVEDDDEAMAEAADKAAAEAEAAADVATDQATFDQQAELDKCRLAEIEAAQKAADAITVE